MRLPNYGVFDHLAFSHQDGVATVAGFASTAALKDDGLRAREVPGPFPIENELHVEAPLTRARR